MYGWESGGRKGAAWGCCSGAALGLLLWGISGLLGIALGLLLWVALLHLHGLVIGVSPFPI